MQDFDLVFADPRGVERCCDQFEALDLTAAERFHFMQLIVASLDLALKKQVPGVESSAQRVEELLRQRLEEYKYIIDYWGRADTPWQTYPMMKRLKSDPRYIYTGGAAPFE